MKKALLIFIKIIRRLKINLVLYRVLKFLRLNKTVEVSEEKDRQAFSYLSSIHSYHETSCFCSHTMRPLYDLHIIVPAYQQEQYICDCIDSILSQKTEYSYFLTIVNDGSTDGTSTLLGKYSNNERVEIIKQKNCGISEARNSGMKTIMGKYLMFVDSDDILSAGAIENLMDKAFAEDADIVEGSLYAINNNNKILRSETHSLYVGNEWIGKLRGYACGRVCKSELFAHYKFPKGLWFEDTIMSLLIYPQCHKIVTIPDDVYHYRMNSMGISALSQGKPKVVDTLWITSLLLKESLSGGENKKDDLLKVYLGQVKMNFQRIETLMDYKACKASFYCHRHLLLKYFGEVKDSSDLYACLRNGNFGGYVLLCL